MKVALSSVTLRVINSHCDRARDQSRGGLA